MGELKPGYITENFTKKEMACKCGRPDCPARDGENMSPGFMVKLQAARSDLGSSMIVRSGSRCIYWNRHEGGKDDSAHLVESPSDMAWAVDIEARTSRARWRLVRALMPFFNRIGINKALGFIHVDDDQAKAENVIFIY